MPMTTLTQERPPGPRTRGTAADGGTENTA